MKVVKQSESTFYAAKKHFQICYIFNQKVWDKAAVSMYSILKKEPNTAFEFHIINPMGENGNYFYYNKLAQIIRIGHARIHFYLVNESSFLFKNYRTRWPPLIMAKLYLSSILEIDDVVYLDVDMMAIRPFSEVYHYNIDRFYFAGCSTLDIFPGRWINSGIIHYNLKKIRQSGKMNYFINCTQSLAYNFYDDWCHTFCYPRNEVLVMPYKFNLMIHAVQDNESRFQVATEIENVVMAHFMHRSKKALYASNKKQIQSVNISNKAKSFMYQWFDLAQEVKHYLELF